METIFDYVMRTKCGKKKKPKLKVHPQDDLMMEDGTINPNHYTLQDGYISERDYNNRLRASGGGM